tara:strand:- start:1309 stop:1734 length:426 start_codon:yes stop_codon:yes gene_type:complete
MEQNKTPKNCPNLENDLGDIQFPTEIKEKSNIQIYCESNDEFSDVKTIQDSGWIQTADTNLVELFSDILTLKQAEVGIEFEKFDFKEHYNADYYREKFPHFDDEWYELMEAATTQKFEDLRRYKEPVVMKPKTEEDFTIKF